MVLTLSSQLFIMSSKDLQGQYFFEKYAKFSFLYFQITLNTICCTSYTYKQQQFDKHTFSFICLYFLQLLIFIIMY